MADQELRDKVPTKSASAKKLAPVEGAEPEINEAVAEAAEPAEVEEAAPEDEDSNPEAAIAAPAPANDSLPAPPLPRPSPSFGGGGSRAPGGVPGRMMPPPRPMAKAENFVEGDHVVYPTHGVGKVERIATEEIAGHKLELIHITFEENRMTLRVPVAKARTAGLRKLATRKLFDEALAVLKGRARIKRTMWSRRAQEYEAKINSGDPLSIAEVVRDLHRNAGQPDQSFSERQIYEAAMDRLAAELAALERIDKTAAATKLVEFLKTV
jgi:CarD family transcriptional regulator